ncbi:Nitrogen assimilation transcription factor nirA [Talaromyces islandicus]|uniref:Nitrogen assimilation transcription factor nirA n=1 Tax=Talaromyces islandicus TaxID=28573 RepID=A0A0U1LZP4_TALIS|nr:Nitrogen assimilation transcription factor nirA [Talaromyces islandicus]
MEQRRRVSVACTLCRQKRVKCDGAKPRCIRCISEAKSCEYRYEEEKRKPPSKKYVQALHERIRILEEQLAQHQTSYNNASLQTPVSFRPQRTAPPHEETNSGLSKTDQNTNSPINDLVDLVGGLSLGEGDQLRYFGSRSNLSLVQQPLDRKYNPPRQSSSQTDSGIEIDGLSLDTRNALLQIFWEWQNPWQYLVHKKAFMDSLNSGSNDGYCTPLLLYSILALAARYSDRVDVRSDPGDTSTAGDAYVDRAKALLHQEVEAPRVSTVIAAALIALKEMSVDKEPAGWTYIGIAVRMAYNLGLHVDPSKMVQRGFLTTQAAEIRSIAWWGCYLVEKLFTVGIGRPSIILERDVHAPLPSILSEVDFYPWNNDDTLPQTSCSSYSITTFRNTCEMFRMIARPLDDIYAHPTNSPTQKQNLVTEINLILTDFYNKIPSIMRLPSSLSKTPLPPHIYCFHLHYHALSILVHRPFIVSPPSDPFDNLLNQPAFSHLETCTQSAESITLLFRAYAGFYTLRRISISVVDPARTAAIIHLFNMTSNDRIVQEKAKSLFIETAKYIKEMSTAWAWSRRALRALILIAQRWSLDQYLPMIIEIDPPSSQLIQRDSSISTPIHDTQPQIVEGGAPSPGLETDHITGTNFNEIPPSDAGLWEIDWSDPFGLWPFTDPLDNMVGGLWPPEPPDQ